MINKKIDPVKEFEPIEEISTLLSDVLIKDILEERSAVPRDDISFLLKKHYGFKLPNHCSLHIITREDEDYSDNDNKYGTFLLFIDRTRLGRVTIRRMVNSPYFRYMSILEDPYGESLVYLVFEVKSGFKKEYNALRGKHEFA